MYLYDAKEELQNESTIRGDSWSTSDHQCPYCLPEFDGHPVKATKLYHKNSDLDRYDTICTRCQNAARMYEITNHDRSLYDSKTTPSHLLRWEFKPTEWAELENDPFGFYSRTWEFTNGAQLDQDTFEFGLIAHGAADGGTRLPIPGMGVTGRIYDEV